MRVKHKPAHLNDDVSYDAWLLPWIAISRTDLSGVNFFTDQTYGFLKEIKAGMT